MLTIKVGLIDTTGQIDPETMTRAAAALNVQVTRDLPQFGPISASVSYLPGKHAVPQGVWPVQIVKSLPPGEGGFHTTKKNNQPFAKVILTPDSSEWTVDASHETIEMLVDPSGNRLQTSTSIEIVKGAIVDGTGTFEYLVEACDPCEADDCTYQIDGISVSDFLTPHFYDPHVIPGTRYSFTGALTKPREIRQGGYISWVDPISDEVQQLLWVDPNAPPQIRNLGSAAGLSLRHFVENQTHPEVRAKRRGPSAAARDARKLFNDRRREVAEARGRRYE
jgi:hypothetical protein